MRLRFQTGSLLICGVILLAFATDFSNSAEATPISFQEALAFLGYRTHDLSYGRFLVSTLLFCGSTCIALAGVIRVVLSEEA